MILGFELNKISVERLSRKLSGGVKVKHNLEIDNVKEEEIKAFKDGGKAVSMEFSFSVDYEPDIGGIMINGGLIYVGEGKKVKEVMELWKKKKALPDDVSMEVVNTILMRCNVKALELADDINLPSHIPLPTIKQNIEKFSDYIG